jgi:diacylglycerol kinase (ATP)
VDAKTNCSISVGGADNVIPKARLIYNPSSGREEVKRHLSEILSKLEKSGFETSCHATEGEGDAASAAREAINRRFDLIIAAGGDGTVSEVINGMAEQPWMPPLGILPFGTTNDLARALGIPKQWELAIELINRRNTKRIDVGKVNDRYFINIAGGGSLTELTYEVPSKMKTLLGQLAYYLKGLEKLPRLRPIPINIRSPHKKMDEEVMLFLIANSNSVGGFEKLAPGATIDDGMFDVIIIKKMNLPEFIRLAGLVMRGEHMNDPGIIHFKTNELEVYSADDVMLNLDGELGGNLPCHCKVLPRHLEIIVDKEGHSTYNQSMFGFKVLK